MPPPVDQPQPLTVPPTSEPIEHLIDMNTWHQGQDLQELMVNLQQQVGEAVDYEQQIREVTRDRFLPRLYPRKTAPECAGVYRMALGDVERIWRNLLFRGHVQACDGSSVTHQALPISVLQLGVCLIAYDGSTGSWSQHLYRRDWHARANDLEAAMTNLLEHRYKQQTSDDEESGPRLTDIRRRAVMTYAERYYLTHQAQARWRMGHGHPIPFEIATGAGRGYEAMLTASTQLFREMVAYRRFVFVSGEQHDRALLMIGDALEPLEFAIIDTIEADLHRVVARSHSSRAQKMMDDFVAEIGPQIVRGVYRASRYAPAAVFFAHRDFAREAAHIAIADSALQPHRGFPLLLDLADRCCRAYFGAEDFNAALHLAYTRTGQPLRYLSERSTR